MKKIILTGGPGSGKTTLLNRLAKETGWVTVPEAARLEIAENGRREDTQKRIYDRAKKMVEEAPENAILDRTHLDALAYGYKPEEEPARIEEAEVWWLPHRPERYKNDNERTETAEEAKEIGERLKRLYEELGYTVRVIDLYNPPKVG
jgi:predicted ATPase